MGQIDKSMPANGHNGHNDTGHWDGAGFELPVLQLSDDPLYSTFSATVTVTVSLVATGT